MSAIYESTNASPTLLHLILATLIPAKQRIRIGTSIERHAPDGSLTRAVLAWGTTVGLGLLLLKVFGNQRNHHNGMVEESSSQEKNSLWAILSEMLGIKRDNRIDTSSRSSSKKNGPATPKSLFPFSDAEDVVHEGCCHCGAISFEVRLFQASKYFFSILLFPCRSLFIFLGFLLLLHLSRSLLHDVSRSVFHKMTMTIVTMSMLHLTWHQLYRLFVGNKELPFSIPVPRWTLAAFDYCLAKNNGRPITFKCGGRRNPIVSL